MSSSWVSGLRVALTGALGGGLVAAAMLAPTDVDLTALSGDGSGATASAPSGASSEGSVATRAATLLCPGAELTGIEGVADARTPGRAAAATAPASALPVTTPQGAGSLSLGPLTDTPAEPDTRERGTAVSAPLTAAAAGAGARGALAPGLVAGQEWRVDDTTLRGLASAPCVRSGSQAWLVGGGGQPGRQERLVLLNPGANVVTADVRVLGARGPVTSTTGRGTVVPAHGRTVILLDAIAGSERRPVVHVTATGGTLGTVLADTWLDGTVPAGAESSGPVAPPAQRQTIPGVVVGGPGSGAVRVAVPGDQEGVVRLRLLTASGGRPLPGANVVTVPAGGVGEVPLTGVPAGRYAVEVRADVPVVAGAARVVREGAGRGDLAWAGATPAIESLAGVALPATSGVTRTLTLTSGPDAARADVVWVSGGQTRERSLTLAASTAQPLDLGAATAVWVRPRVGEVHAALDSVSGTGAAAMVSTTALTESAVTSSVGRAYPAP